VDRPVVRWSALWILAAVFALSAVLGCGGSAAGPDPRWTSAHFRYFADSDDPGPCSSVTDLLEQHFAAMQSYLGFDWPASKTVDYDKFRDANAFRTNSTCQAPQVACESAGTVQSTITFDEHELIHAYLSPSGRAPALFEEGVAVVLTWRSMVCNTPANAAAPELSWADAIRIGDPNTDGRIYLSGARLVAHLLRRYDPHLFMRLYRALPRTATPELVSDQMMSIYGKSGDELWANAVADAVANADCVPAWPCARDALPLDGSAAHLAASCAGIDHDQRTFRLTATSNLFLSATADTLELFACDPDAPPPPVSFFPIWDGPERSGLINLGPGNYFLDFFNYPTDLALSIPDGSPTGTDCAALQPLPLSPSQYPIQVTSPLSSGDWFVAFQIGSPARMLTVSNDETTDLLLCPSCDFTSASCRAIPKAMPWLDVDLEQVVYARMRGRDMKIALP